MPQLNPPDVHRPIDRPHWSTAIDRIDALIATKRFGFFADFDGTLCKFPMYPDRPSPTVGMLHALAALTEKLPLVSIITGRAAPDARDFLNLPNIVYVGNHGLEFLRDDNLVVVEDAKIWEDRLTAFVRDLGEPSIPTVRYQPKRITMSVTYGRSENPDEARARLHDLLRRVNEPYGFILSEGHTLWEVKPPIAHNKGTALVTLIKEFELDAAIFSATITPMYPPCKRSARCALPGRSRQGWRSGCAIKRLSRR